MYERKRSSDALGGFNQKLNWVIVCLLRLPLSFYTGSFICLYIEYGVHKGNSRCNHLSLFPLKLFLNYWLEFIGIEYNNNAWFKATLESHFLNLRLSGIIPSLIVSDSGFRTHVGDPVWVSGAFHPYACSFHFLYIKMVFEPQSSIPSSTFIKIVRLGEPFQNSTINRFLF